MEALAAEQAVRKVELTEIPAPPFMEEVRAARFAELLRESGADSVWIDAGGNVRPIPPLNIRWRREEI